MMPARVVKPVDKRIFGLFLLFSLFLLPLPASAQTTPKRSLITQPVDESNLTILKGNTYPLARTEFDRGAAPLSLPTERMLLVLKRTPEQEAALDALLDQQQDKSSPNFHKWLTPGQFGQQFGPTDEDIQAITSWLQSHGFQVNKVSNGRLVIEFSGTAAQVQEAFHTTIHKYLVDGKDHWANSADPQIPAALKFAVAGIDTLHNFPRKSMHQLGGIFQRSKETGKAVRVTANPSPGTLFTLPAPGGCGVQRSDCYALSPYDFGTIYDVLPLWNASPKIDGTGQTIAVVAESNINPNDVTSFRKFFGLPTAANLKITVSGPDPGPTADGAETEADLDVEWAGAIAPNATIDLVVAESTEVSLGADLAAVFAVDNNLAPVLNVSFGICELGLGTTGNQFFNQLWQQAAAQGITVDVATGDSGAAVCDRSNNPPPAPAVFGLTVSGFSSTPYNVAIGGTDFNDLTDASTFWNLNNVPPANNPSAIATASAKSYIPETTWNDTCTNGVFGSLLGFSQNAETNCNNPQLAFFVQAVGGSGGKSNCISSDGQNVSSCTGGYSKPPWQVGTGVPNDQARDVPDASLFAAIGSPSGSFYIICQADALPTGVTSCDPTDPNSEFFEIGGTSASAPTFSAIMSLVNQKTGSRQGNANYILYKLAAQQPTAFHDVPVGGTIAMPCAKGSPDCTVTNPADLFGVLSGYSTTAGYDLATGLGSVDANNLVTKWDLITTKSSLTTLNLTPAPVKITHGQSVNFTIDVASALAGGGQPTGNVSLIANTGPSGQQGVQGFTLNNGAVSGTTNGLPGGNYTVVAQYPGDGVFGPSESSATSVTVAPEPSKVQFAFELFDPVTNLQTNPNATTAVFGTPSILRVNVTSQAGDACPSNAPGSAGCPTGSLTLTNSYNGGTANPLDAGTYPLNSLGYAEDQVIDLPGGMHTLKAIYSGDNSYSPPASPAADTLMITQAPTTTTITAGPTVASVGSVVNLDATFVAQNIFSNFLPVDVTVNFYVGNTLVASAGGGDIVQGPNHQVTFITFGSTTSLPHGQLSIVGKSSGDASYAPSTSAPITVSVLYPTNLALISSNPTIQRGTSVTFTAQATSTQTGAPPITGSVQFASDGVPLGSMNLANGQAQFTTSSLPVGTHTISAQYAGDSNYFTSNNQTTETVNLLATTTTITTSNSSVPQGQSVTLTAHVAPAQAGGPALTGTVQFFSSFSLTGGDTPLGSAPLSNGQAQITTSALPANTQFVFAGYSGDSNYANSTGSTAQTVTPAPDFSVAANPQTIVVVGPGNMGSTMLTFTAMNGFTGTISLTPSACSGLPSESSCSFSPSSITFTGGTAAGMGSRAAATTTAGTAMTTTLMISTMAPSSAAPQLKHGPLGPRPATYLLAAIFALLFLLSASSKWKRRQAAFATFLAVATLLAFAACGGGGGGTHNPGTPVGVDPNVVVSISSGSVSHSLQLTVNVE